MATTADFKIGACIEFNNDLMIIMEFQRFQTGRGASNVRTRMRSMNTGKIIDHTFTGGEKVEFARIERRPHQYLYKEEAGLVFMNTNTYEQVTIPEKFVDNMRFLKEATDCFVIFNADNEQPLSVELPQFVELEVTYTEPGIQGDTARSALKPATLETGAEIRVPLFVNQGEIIRVNTQDGSYHERVK